MIQYEDLQFFYLISKGCKFCFSRKLLLSWINSLLGMSQFISLVMVLTPGCGPYSLGIAILCSALTLDHSGNNATWCCFRCVMLSLIFAEMDFWTSPTESLLADKQGQPLAEEPWWTFMQTSTLVQLPSLCHPAATLKLKFCLLHTGRAQHFFSSTISTSWLGIFPKEDSLYIT
jgi:hypothetical protein